MTALKTAMLPMFMVNFPCWICMSSLFWTSSFGPVAFELLSKSR